MTPEYVDASDLIQPDNRSPAQKWLDAEMDKRWANEQGAEPFQILEAIALEVIEENRRLRAQIGQAAVVQQEPVNGEWVERWHGSKTDEGWSILFQSLVPRDKVAYLGTGVSAEAVQSIVYAHNQALSALQKPLLQRIAELEANEKVLLAQVQGHMQWREKIFKASEQAYGENAIRYKFSLTKSGKVMNMFPKEIDGRWFALVPAEDDGHIGHIARIAELEKRNSDLHEEVQRFKKHALNQKAALLELERQLEEARKDVKPCPTCESLARAVMLDQTGKA